MMKYEQPEIEIIRFANTDILNESEEPEDTRDPAELDEYPDEE